eukprot:Gb_13383 [translate_table: standard]
MSVKGYDAKGFNGSYLDDPGCGSDGAHGKRKESGPNIENEIQKDASLRNARSHGSEDRNPVHKPESNDKVIEDTALLEKAENCQPEARPSGASPNLTCRKRNDEPPHCIAEEEPSTENIEESSNTSDNQYTGFQTYETGQGFNNHQNVNVGNNWSNNNTWGNNNLNLGRNATMSPNGGNQNNFYGNFGNNHSFQIGIPNFGGQACLGFNNTNIFQNSNSLGGTNTFNQGPTYPNNCWNNILGSYGNGSVLSMNPTNQFNNNYYNGVVLLTESIPKIITGEYGFVKKEDDAASSRDSSESTTNSYLESTYHCERASDPHKPILEEETNINSDVDSEEFITNCLHKADELNHHSCFHLERLPDIDKEEEMGYYEEDSDVEDSNDEEEIEPEVI